MQDTELDPAIFWRHPDELTTRAPFETLFPRATDVQLAITASMRENGFDVGHPIVVWDDTVVEGHTRLIAARTAGVERVAIVQREFEDETAALEYAIREQRDRRNLRRDELTAMTVRAIEAIDQRKIAGRPSDSELASPEANSNGKSADDTADLIGSSRATVERVRYVLDHGTEDTKQLLREGVISPRGAYNMVRDDERPHQAEARQLVVPPPVPTFNQVNDNIGWARWSWNPVTGCLHNCQYCYARDIANRFYPKGFAPDFRPERLPAPKHTAVPAEAAEDPAWRRVFTCSMADLFGKWVPQEWIDAVFEQIVAAPQWEFLCLTKFPQRLATLDWPDNVWAGTTVDKQHRVDLAQRHFAEVKAGVKWLSCEPLLEPLKFDSLEMFDWVVIGSCTSTSGMAEFAPQWDWVLDLYTQARDAGCKVYLKHNLFGAKEGTGPGIVPVREWPR